MPLFDVQCYTRPIAIMPDPLNDSDSKLYAAHITSAAIEGIRAISNGRPLNDIGVKSQLREVHDCSYCFTIINGYAGAGKSTFVDRCRVMKHRYGVSPDIYEVSSIDPVRDCVGALIKTSYNGKTNNYRNLLSNVKRAWLEFDSDGPTNYLIDYIRKAISSTQYFDKFIQFGEIYGTTPTYIEPITSDNINPAYVFPRMHFFFHIREKDEMDKLIHRLRLLYPHSEINTLLITGRRETNPAEFTNDSDRNAESADIEYDYIAYNTKGSREIDYLAARYLNICDCMVANRICSMMGNS